MTRSFPQPFFLYHHLVPVSTQYTSVGTPYPHPCPLTNVSNLYPFSNEWHVSFSSKLKTSWNFKALSVDKCCLTVSTTSVSGSSSLKEPPIFICNRFSNLNCAHLFESNHLLLPAYLSSHLQQLLSCYGSITPLSSPIYNSIRSRVRLLPFSCSSYRGSSVRILRTLKYS